MNKQPAIDLAFWVMKICATTLGETAGDLLSMTMNVGYAKSTLILLGLFFVVLLAQLFVKTYKPLLYWGVILATSTAGTTASDYMDRTLELGYAKGALLLTISLLGVLGLWRLALGSLSVTTIKNRRVELFYWGTVLISNTLGTAVGDYLSDDSGFGFRGSALLIGSLLLLIGLATFYSRVSKVLLFWLAFVLTRPFGAEFGDLLTKDSDQGGLGLGTVKASLILLAILLASIVWAILRQHRGKDDGQREKRE